MKKLMSISDLHNYYKSQGLSIKFSSMESNSPIVVHITEPFIFSSSEDNELFLKTNLRFCHTEKNVNESYISKETMEEALPTVYNMPILGYIWDDNGTPKFAGHEMYENQKGDVVYEEIPIGIVPESSPLSFNENENGKTYLEGTGLIWKTYSKAAEIMKREKKLSVSVELLVDDLTYDEENDVLVLNKIRFTGVTILEEDPETGKEILPGMQGAEITIEDFSMKNSLFAKEEIKEFIKASIAEALDNINSKEGGKKMKFSEEKLNELLEKYAVKSEDLTFDLEAIESDEALEKAFEAQFSNPSPEPTATEENIIKMSLTLGETVKEFSRSLSEVIYALTDLVNATYSDDNTMYAVDVYDDGSAKSKYLIMQDFFTGKAYRQGWSLKDGIYSLKGERTEVFSVWVTAEEREQLESLKTNYEAKVKEFESASKELSLYKEEPDKLELLNSPDYSSIKKSAEFEDLSKRENYFSLSKEELEGKLDGILLTYSKQKGKEQSDDDEPDIGIKMFGTKKETKSHGRYGSMFVKD